MARKLLQLLFIVVCFCSLVFIAVQTLRMPTTHTSENRALTQQPAFPVTQEEISTYPGKLESWWNDSIHYRQYFIRISALMRMAVGINPHGQVLVGKDGWFFWTGERSDEAFRNNNPLSPEEVQHWRNYLVYRHLDAIKHGARYLFVPIPNKENVYPEYMPSHMTRLGKQSWLGQITESVKQDGVLVADMRNIMEAGKKNDRLYIMTDTHWNLIGANYGQYELITKLQAVLPLLKPKLYSSEDFKLVPSVVFEGTGIPYYSGLTYMLGIPDTVSELQPLPKKPLAICAKKAQLSYGPWDGMQEPQRSQTIHATRCKTGHYHVVMFRDSFAEHLEPFLSGIFEYIVYAWMPRPNDMRTWSFFLETNKPDIILDEIIERYLVLVPQPGVDYPADFKADAVLNSP